MQLMNSIQRFKNITILLFIILLLSSCVSRLIRPTLTGTIVDFEGNPIENCSVGSVKTDKDGYFELVEIRKNRFYFTELFKMEAPPIFISEPIHKDGYIDEKIEIFHKYGGGLPKGATWNLDSIHLMKSSFDEYSKLLQNSWLAVDMPDENTLYLLRNNFKKRCKTKKCNTISNKLDTNITKSPQNSNVTRIHLKLKENGQMDIVKIIHYRNISSTNPNFKENDTLRTQGKWFLNSGYLRLSSNLEEIEGTYHISPAENVGYQYVVLRRFKNR